MSRTIVTTSHKPGPESQALAAEAAYALGSVLVERERKSLDQLRAENGAENVLVVNRNQLVLYTSQGECFFHPSMSIPRIKAIKQGKPDHMVAAMSLRPGFRVLDCTMGLGSDAIVAAYAVGPDGDVTGVEAAPELALIVAQGLADYRKGSRAGVEAMQRIRVICGNYLEVLGQQPDNSFDVVYFDPMFRVPRHRSSSMQPVRGIVNNEPLSELAVHEAVRVARCRVVLKENEFSGEFARLGFNTVIGGKYSPVAFGIIEKQGAGK
jgi:protein-L-isoaspartate O-methyltransferase